MEKLNKSDFLLTKYTISGFLRKTKVLQIWIWENSVKEQKME